MLKFYLLILLVTDLKFTVKLGENTVEPSELDEKLHSQPFSLEFQSSNSFQCFYLHLSP